MSDEKSRRKIRKRNWAFVLYPDSAPADWEERLKLTGLQGVISPLHDKDINPTEEEKKAHYHVIITYNGPTSFSVVRMLTESLNAPIPQALESVRGYYRYLTHKDNPDKYQYDEREIKILNGFNVSNFIELTKSEVNEIKRKLQDLIRDQNVVEYSVFMDFLLDNDLYLEYDVASSHTYFFDKYITSRRNQSGQAVRVLVVSDNGEILENKNHD